MSNMGRRLAPIVLISMAGIFSPWMRGVAQDVPALVQTFAPPPGPDIKPAPRVIAAAAPLREAEASRPDQPTSNVADGRAEIDAKVAPVRRQRPKAAAPSPWMVAAISNLQSKAKPFGLGGPVLSAAKPACSAAGVKSNKACPAKVAAGPSTGKPKSAAKSH